MTDLSKELFCKMGEKSADGYFIYHIEKKKMIYANLALANIWQLDLKSILDDPKILMHNIHEEDVQHVLYCYKELMEDLEAKKYEFWLHLNDDSKKYVVARVYPLVNDHEQIVTGIVEDTTIARRNKLHIEEINAKKNITLEVLSHDLSAPLGMMKLMASSIEKEIAEMENATVSDALDFIKTMCERNMLLVRSVINHEFLKSSEVEIKKERADIVKELKEVIRFYRRSQLRLTKHFEFSSDQDKLFISLDSMKFLQVINNLISNSIKFTQDGGLIAVHVQERENTVLITVKDDGIGIPKHLQKNLFDRMAQTLRPGLKGEESGGLGMSIIKAIIDLHKGKIGLESEEGKGCVFYIELPK